MSSVVDWITAYYTKGGRRGKGGRKGERDGREGWEGGRRGKGQME